MLALNKKSLAPLIGGLSGFVGFVLISPLQPFCRLPLIADLGTLIVQPELLFVDGKVSTEGIEHSFYSCKFNLHRLPLGSQGPLVATLSPAFGEGWGAIRGCKTTLDQLPAVTLRASVIYRRAECAAQRVSQERERTVNTARGNIQNSANKE